MDPRISSRYRNEILEEAVIRYGISVDQAKLLDGFESYIYAFSRSDGDFILRISHNLRREKKHILGEVDWINYLSAGGAGVAKAVLSNGGKLVEFIDDQQGGSFMVTAFQRAPGEPPSGAYWNPNLFRNWGRLLGRIHFLSKEYMPSNPAWKRYEWDSQENMQVSEWLPLTNTKVLERFNGLMTHLQTLQKDGESYGLIHQDAHGGNLFVDSDYQLTLFDFDDCVYGWYIYDIAMVFFYALMGHEKDQQGIETFCRHFLEGYRQENELNASWLTEIPFFLKLREIDLYAQIHYAFGGFEKVDDAWCQRYLRGRQQKIETDTPYIHYDWLSLRSYLVG